MCREDGQEFPGDSGWRFFAGDEDDAYMEVQDNTGIYTLNTLCNYDKDILPYLDKDAPCAYQKTEQGSYQLVESDGEEAGEDDEAIHMHTAMLLCLGKRLGRTLDCFELRLSLRQWKGNMVKTTTGSKPGKKKKKKR